MADTCAYDITRPNFDQLRRLRAKAERLDKEWEALRPASDRAVARLRKRIDGGEDIMKAHSRPDYAAGIGPANDKIDEFDEVLGKIHAAVPRTPEDWAVKFWALRLALGLPGDSEVHLDDLDYPDFVLELFSRHVTAAIFCGGSGQ